MTKIKQTPYEKLTAQIISKIESSGRLPWQKPWRDNPNLSPVNLISGNAYKGMNSFILDGEFSSNYWLTYKQATDKGGNVRKGEKGQQITYWQMRKYKDADTGEEKAIPFLKLYTVFNLTQCDGIDEPQSEFEGNELPANDKAEAIIQGYQNGPSIQIGNSNRAYYQPSKDAVVVPSMEQYGTADEYYSVMFHELGHSTGSEKRLKRPMGDTFGSHGYSKEELVAELTACFLCKEAGINTTIDNSAAYLQGWMSKLSSDPKLLVSASSAATKAANHILNAA